MRKAVIWETSKTVVCEMRKTVFYDRRKTVICKPVKLYFLK